MPIVQAIRYSKPLNKCSTCIKTVYTHNCGHMLVKNSEALSKKTCRQCFPPVTSRISMQSRPVTTYTLKNVPIRGICRKRDCPAREFEEYENLRTCNTCSYEFVEYACHVIPKSNGEEEGSGKLCETCDFSTQGGQMKIPESRPKIHEDKSTYTLKHCSYCRVRECSKCEAFLTEYLCGHSIWRPFPLTRQSEPCLTCHLDDKIPSTTNPYWVYKIDNSRECDACEIKQSSRNTSPAPDTFSRSETRQLSTTFEESSRKDPSQSPFKTKTTIKIEHQDSYESTPSLERSSRRDRHPEASRSKYQERTAPWTYTDVSGREQSSGVGSSRSGSRRKEGVPIYETGTSSRYSYEYLSDEKLLRSADAPSCATRKSGCARG